MGVKDKVIQLHSEGVCINDILEILKCNKSYIYRILRDKDICTPTNIKNKECIELLKNTDMTFFMISRHLSMCESVVRKLAYDGNLREKKKAIW